MPPARPRRPSSTAPCASWERSCSRELSGAQGPAQTQGSHAEPAERPNANARLVSFSRPVIENLYQQIGSRSAAIVLADRHGMVLNIVGCPGFLDRAAGAARSAGVQWRETAVGSHAIGAALHTGTTVTVHGDEHLLDGNRVLVCVATPILAPCGGVVGILDFSTDTRGDFTHATALLSTAAELIEHHLIESLETGFLSVGFHVRAELLGSPLEALTVFDECGTLLASNRTARRLLSLDPRHPAARCHECFATSWSVLVVRAAEIHATPLPLGGIHGDLYSARMRLHEPRQQGNTLL